MKTITAVVAKYLENIEWINTLPSYIKVKIYDKSNGSIPNIGRESETYIRYILEHYDSLSDFTVFLQGNPWDHMRGDLKTNFYKLLENPDNIDDNNIIPLENYRHEHIDTQKGKSLEAFRCFFIDAELPATFEFSSGAQYIVPRSCITHRSRDFYQAIWNKMHSTDISSTGSSPVDPWTIERLWGYIFNPNIKSKNEIIIP